MVSTGRSHQLWYSTLQNCCACSTVQLETLQGLCISTQKLPEDQDIPDYILQITAQPYELAEGCRCHVACRFAMLDDDI